MNESEDDNGIDQATRDCVESAVDRMEELFPEHYSMYRSDKCVDMSTSDVG